MRKLAKVFDEIWSKAEKRNRQDGCSYHKILSTRGRYTTYGIYDAKSKSYVLFDTINLIGNFRYSTRAVPAEFAEMDKLVSA